MFKLKIQSKEKNILLLLSILAFILLVFLIFFNSSTLSFTIPSGTNANQIWLIRLQIILKVVLSAAAIGLSNYLIQILTKNRFADVSIMGINTFQQLVIAILILFASNFFLDYEQSYIFSLIYLGIAFISSGIFYLISYKTNLSSRLVLIYGIFLNISVTALAYLILTSNAINPDIVKIRFSYYQAKVFGGIKISNDLSNVYVSLGLLIICIIAAFCLRLKIMAQSSLLNKTSTLGFKDKHLNFFVILIISILASIIFSLVGIIGFVGVTVSFIANYLFTHFKYSVVGSMLCAIILMLASQFVQIGISHIASAISLTTIAGGISCFIFIVFLISKK